MHLYMCVCVSVGWLLGTDKSKFTCASLLFSLYSATRRTSVTDLTCYTCVCVYVCVCIRKYMRIYLCMYVCRKFVV